MPCTSIAISQHAFLRAIERGIDLTDAVSVVRQGVIIADYPDDLPFPSRLMLGFALDGKALHVVVGESPDARCTIITVYYPETDKWETDFKTRKATKP